MMNNTIIDRVTVQGWLDRYVHAWKKYDRAEIAALFNENVAYQFNPWDTPLHSRDAVVSAWLDPATHDDPQSFEAHYEPVIIEGDTAVVRGISTYYTDATHTAIGRQFANLWIVRFDEAGACREFIEWFFENPSYKAGQATGSAASGI